MKAFSYRALIRQVVLGAALVLLVLSGVWGMGEFVRAYQEITRAHVFPTQVDTVGWKNANNALVQDLSAEAALGTFNSENSAFVLIEENILAVDESEEVMQPVVDGQQATTTKEQHASATSTPLIESDVSSEGDSDLEEESVEEVGDDTSVSTSTDPVQEEEAVEPPVQDDVQIEDPSTVDPQESDTSTTTSETSALQQAASLALRRVGEQVHAALGMFIHTVLATTTSETVSEHEVVTATSTDLQPIHVATTSTPPVIIDVFDDQETSTSSDSLLSTSTTDASLEIDTSLPIDEVDDSIDVDSEPPVITILGNNPARIAIGAQYNDLGVIVADAVNPNLGHAIYVDDVLVSDVQIDTSESRAYVITYEAEDLAGNIARVKRLVLVGDAEADLSVIEPETESAGAAESKPEDSIARCTLLDKPCHTITLSGFGVSGDSTHRAIRDAAINLSFAHAIPDEEVIDDRLLVRYFHEGTWRHAGEIFLNKEVSNRTHGGYFVTELPELDSWEELDDLQIVVEYDRGEHGNATQLYLDSAWLDISYVDRTPEDDESAAFETLNPHISLELAQGGAHTLILPDESSISFDYADDLEDGLMMRVDKQSYQLNSTTTLSGGASNVVYASITNEGDAAEHFTLYAAFPDAKSSFASISQLLHNVPDAQQSPLAEDVTFFCEEGWQHATSSSDHQCISTGERQVCTEVDESGSNCLVQEFVVGYEETIVYERDWVEQSFESLGAVSEESEAADTPKGYVLSLKSEKQFEILPNQTIYFQLVLSGERQREIPFFLSAVGEQLFGDIDSRLLRREAVLYAERDRLEDEKESEEIKVTEQLSEKADFDGNELPSFRFKFKTPRNFFTRLGDYLLGRNSDFLVESARLRHASGGIERVPVHVAYGENDEWTLRLEKRPRAFRPGKYAIELVLREGEQTYTDTVEFYWGVLAINTNKSVYEPGETAALMMAVLNDSGDTVCDASLVLEITDPHDEQRAIVVENGEGCGPNNVTTLPDYTAEYVVGDPGLYAITLTRLNGEGEGAHVITDAFEVREDVPLIVERVGPTRIYPPADYTMELIVTAQEDFEGEVIEVMPEGFVVTDTGGGRVSHTNGTLQLAWDVALTTGEQRVLSYEFDAPDISPYLYVVGPASFVEREEIVFEEARTWKIASDAVSIAAGVAWLAGTTTTSSTNLNQSSAAAIEWSVSSEYDSTYFSHSTSTNTQQLTVNIDGDYLIAVTVPMERTDGNNSRSRIEADVRVNGSKRAVGVGRSSYIRNQGGQAESSDHLNVLLEDLNAGDYIEVYLRGITTVDAGDIVNMTGQASLYAEYISSSEQIFFATATTTTSGANFNPATAAEVMWFNTQADTGYTHSNGSSPQDITLDTAGEYLVFVNIPLSGSVSRSNVIGTVRLNGAIVNGGEFKQGYIRNSEADTNSSVHWSGVVRATTTSQALTIEVIEEATSGTLTVGSDVGSIYIQKLPTTDVYIGRGNDLTNGTNWNTSTQAQIEWETDDVIDTGVFTHSTTTNPHQITVDQDGDYFFVYNDSLNGGSGRSNPRITVEVNGSPISGAQTKSHYQRAAGNNNEASGSLVFLLRNLVATDVITVSTQQEGAGGTTNDDQDAMLLLWRKAQQNSFIQSTYRWYANTDAEPPTDPWPSGAVDLNEDESLTTGTSVLDGDQLRIRMGLQADTATSAGADAFKLQYAVGTTCGPALGWTDIGTTTSSEIWRAYNNASVSAGSTLSTTTLSLANVVQTYEEENPSAVTPNALTTGQYGEWDWSIENNGATEGTSYCFRMVASDGQLLKDYVEYPQLVTNGVPTTPVAQAPFDNAKTASTTPFFEFTATDPNTENLHYQVQVDDDYAFGSPDIDRNSLDHLAEFENLNTSADKPPFTSGERIRFTPTTALSNNTTYWWRVRVRDPNGTNEWSNYSSVQSLTIDTTLSTSAWFQTMEEQFDTDTLLDVDATTSDNVEIIGVNATGTIYSTAIDYDDAVIGNAWGNVSWNDTETNGTIAYQVEYFTATSSWNLIPDSDLPGNSTGTGVSPIQLTTLDTTTYNQIRLVGNFTRNTGTPVLHDWTMSWVLAVAQPSATSTPFDNEKVGTTTPSFTFSTTDPQGDDLIYEVSISTSTAFTASTTRNSLDHTGFSNTASSTDTSPFTEGDTIQFDLQAGDALTNGETYWWRVRARDPGGGNAYSLWSTPKSLTVDTSIITSTWFQTTTEQFENDGTFVLTESVSDSVSVSNNLGKLAIYREATAGDAITTSLFDHSWDTTVREDDVFNLSGGSNIELDSGYYAVVYGARFDDVTGSNRSEMQSYLNLGGTDLPIGWSQGYIRRSSGADESFTSGGGIIYAQNDNDPLILRTFRSDVNSATVQRVANTSGIQLLRLEDSWDYIRLSKTGTQNGPTSASWVDVTYDRQDEIDTSSFTHATGSSAVTLKDAGHYLVFANTYGAITSNDRTEVIQKLTLNDADVEGSFTTAYIRGNQNSESTFEGAASIGMIIETTASNQILNVETSRGDGTAAWTINVDDTSSYVDRTALTIAKLPDAEFIRLSDSGNDDINPSTLAAMGWNTEDEEDASFSHSTTTNDSRIGVTVDGDYFFLSALYADAVSVVRAVYNQGWSLNGGSLLQYGQSGSYNRNSGANDFGNWAGNIFSNLTNGDYVEVEAQALGGTGVAAADSKSVQGVRIGSLAEADSRPITFESSSVVLSDGTGPKWDSFSWNDTTPASTDITYQMFYQNASGTIAIIPDVDLPGNSSGTSTSPIDLGSLNISTYDTLRARASFTCSGGTCPTLDDWTLSWSEGITVSGTAQEYDESTNVTSGTVAVAVNGTIQAGKTGTISAGTWSIPNVTVFTGDVITVFVDGAADANEAVAVTVYDGLDDVTGMRLYERHLTLGSDDLPTITNTHLGQYDVSQDEDVFHDVNVGNDLSACAIAGCEDVELFIQSGTTYRPDSGNSGDVTTHDIEINGTFVPDANTVRISGSWENNNEFTSGSSAVIFTQTSGTESIDSSLATTSAFFNVTFGESFGTAEWSLASDIDINGNTNVTFGTVNQNGANGLQLAGDLTIGASGLFTKGTGTTTFDGTGTNTWTDNSAGQQDLGIVIVDGTTKTMQLGSAAEATDLTIGSDDTLTAGSSYQLTIYGDWQNNNVFSAQSGTVVFAATTTGHVIAPGNSAFHNATFNGAGGNWAFSSGAVSITNDLTVATGTLTLASGTTTISGSLNANGGTLLHNNGVALFDATGTETIHPGTSPFYDLQFGGSGSWSFGSTHATSSNDTTIAQGTVTLPSGTFAVSGSFANTGGTFAHNNGTLQLSGVGSETIQLGGSAAANLTLSGSGTYTFADTNATAVGNVTATNGVLVLPSGTFSIGGSWDTSGGTFTHSNGDVTFNSSDTGETINAGSSPFYDLVFNSSTGGWTITNSATSTRHTTLTNASALTLLGGQTLEVGGTFTNSIGGASTTWNGSTLYLNSGTSYGLNTKTANTERYDTLIIGANTDIEMWNASATTTTVDSSGSLYSQDHAGVDGDLYVWGSYTSTDDEYWSYANDFDGTVLSGGNQRQANVYISNGSSFVFPSNTLHMVGSASASTTIQNQGSGTYSFSVNGGTLNAQYYQVRNTSVAGFSVLGTTTVTSLADGDFETSVSSGVLLALASTTIDQNPTLEIQRVRFATSTGITGGSNVSVTGTPSSYWWFRNHSGNFDGEDYDNDPGGNPGNVRWDNSGFVITVSGNVYADHGETPLGGPTCDGATPVVRIVVDGGTAYTGSCDAGTGAYSIPGVTFTGDVVLTTYLNTNGGSRAAAVTKTPTANITDLDLYDQALIARHEGVDVLTISDLALFDSSNDSDLLFTAATGTPDTLVTEPDAELFIWAGDTFTPGGNVTLSSGGSGDARDGRLYIDANGTFTAVGSEAHAIGGGFTASTSASFVPAQSTVTFTATTTGKSLNALVPVSFYNLVFSGSGGWALESTATTTVTNALTLTAGALSGDGSLIISSGNLVGGTTIAMTGGTVRLDGAANFGGTDVWQFNNLTFGNGSVGTTTHTGAATTTVAGVFTVANNQVFDAGSAPWVLSGDGTPFVNDGTFNVGTAPVTYTATSSTVVADAVYADLTLAPAGVGSPTYTLNGGTFTVEDLRVGGANPVTVTADTNDPSITISEDMIIEPSAGFTASNIGALSVGGSWSNSGTFTHSNGDVTFNSSDTGETINAGSSPFYDLVFNSSTGGWTITNSATSTRHTTLTNASALTLLGGQTLEVGGTFTNSIGGASTTWNGSTLYLNSGTSYGLNTKTANTERYDTLIIGANTDIEMWNASATTTTVDSSGSLYSQDHAGVDGDLYVWGSYTRSTGSDYWSYETDFDGVDISGSPRKVDVYIASSSSVSMTGGVFDLIGTTTASTTIQNQGSGAYSLQVSGGTLTGQYYEMRNMDTDGFNLSGSPIVTTLSNGDFELSVPSGGTMMTIATSVIDANPLELLQYNRFATSSGVTSGNNVTVTGSTGTSWKFNLHYGNLAGESYDSDPAGDPGYVLWDDSAAQITISGNVYSDEGTTVSSACDGSTPVVRLRVQGAGSYTSSCNASTGLYSIPNVSYNPNDTLTVYLDTNGGVRAANVSVDPITSITNMHLYENRVITRHEDTSPITIAEMAVYDSDDDSDIPFDATDAGVDTLVLPPDTKLIVWDGKAFAPAGNVTLQSGGSGNSWDGSLEVNTNGVFSAAGTQAHSIGGNFILNSGATASGANATFTFAATTTGKTVTLQNASLYNTIFDGTGGAWALTGTTTVNNDFTITNGTVTLTNATTTVGGSFQNTGGSFAHNNGTVLLNSTAVGESIEAGGSDFYNLTANGTGGTWSFTDTHATTTNNFTITNGIVTLPSGVLAVGSSFENSGTFTHNSGTLFLTATTTGKTVIGGGSDFSTLHFNGTGGAWTLADTDMTAVGNITISNGTVTLPNGTLTLGGSWDASGGAFTHNGGTVTFNSTDTGETVDPGASSFSNLIFNSATGGWTINSHATSTGTTTISNANSFTLASGQILAVGGIFTNSVGGSNTTWLGSTLKLSSGTEFTASDKSVATERYDTLIVDTNTDVRMWNASATTTTVDSSGSLYSQDHAGVDGDLYVWGDYVKSSGTDYWSYATDFDGTALGGSSRQVDVRIATSSTITYSGGGLESIGISSATTTIQNQGAGRYAFNVSAGTVNMNYYQLRHLDEDGLDISGTPTITSLSNGDFEMDVPSGGVMITLTPGAIDANAGLQVNTVRFATSTGVTDGFNVSRTSTSTNAWSFNSHYGNYAGEAFDDDGADSCGNIRWDDSSCLFVSQEHYRWRNDDGAQGAPADEWYSASWSKRKKLAITNPNSTTYTNLPVQVVVDYDSDMQSDFDDLRFTDSTGTTTIDYWVESSIASASSTVWIEVPSLPSSSSADIYMYYGNASVASGASGEDTFGFFDNFEDDDVSEYSGDTSLFDTDTTFAQNGTYGLDAGSNVDQKTTNGLYRTGSLIAQGETIRYYQYIDATEDDEPCTLFGVQGSGQNYAVCLDQFPSDRVIIAEDVTSNDGSGTVLASTTVTFTTGWYEVEIDWLTDNSIDVTVSTSSGSTFATVSTSDSTYSSGGMGFSYWFQHGGWDFYSTREYTANDPTYVFGAEQENDGATWKATLDTVLNGLTIAENVRLRFSIQNSGPQIIGQQFRLQVAAKGAALNCPSVPYINYNDVPTTTSGCGSSPACMTTSAQITNQGSTAGLLPYPAQMTFAPGQVLEDPSNQTSLMTVDGSETTEIEYNFQLTNNATDNAYCFRTTNGGLDLDNYEYIAEAVVAHSPVISGFTLNSDNDLTLTEGATTTVYATSTVTDLNGYADLSFATSTIYRSGVGVSCAANENNCYQVASSSCSFSACAGNACTLSCSADLQYFAEATDIGSDYPSENWFSRMYVEDTTGRTDTATSTAVELLTLFGLTINTSDINFGSLSVGQDTGATNATTTIENTGNSNIDIQVLGTDLVDGGSSSIGVGEQKFATSTFAYGSCSICQFLAGSATSVEVDLPKPTSTSTPSSDDLFWGISIPTGTGATLHTGTNTFIATSD